MPQLTTTEWAIVAALFVAFALVLLCLNRRNRRPPFRTIALHGPAVPPEFDQVFGAYGRHGVEGLIVLQDGIRVSFYDGTSIRFIPVIDGQVLYWRDGEAVVEPAP